MTKSVFQLERGKIQYWWHNFDYEKRKIFFFVQLSRRELLFYIILYISLAFDMKSCSSPLKKEIFSIFTSVQHEIHVYCKAKEDSKTFRFFLERETRFTLTHFCYNAIFQLIKSGVYRNLSKSGLYSWFMWRVFDLN